MDFVVNGIKVKEPVSRHQREWLIWAQRIDKNPEDQTIPFLEYIDTLIGELTGLDKEAIGNMELITKNKIISEIRKRVVIWESTEIKN